MVKQAGEGATLKVIGLLPSHVMSDSFTMQNCPFKFPIHPIFVIRGLHQTVNISLPFLQRFKFIIDLDENKLQFKHNNEKFDIPFVPKTKSSISMIEVIASIQDITVLPGQEILVQTIHDLDDQNFTPRPPRIKDSLENDLNVPTGLDINLVPWSVSRIEHDPPGTLRVKNLSEKKRFLNDQFKLGHICNISTPVRAKVDTPTSAERKAQIKAQIEIDKEFQNEYLEDLCDLILNFSNVVSWNGEPGRTHLGETFIDTGSNKPVKCPVQNLSPDVEKIVLEQVDQWLKDGTIVSVCDKGSPWNSRILVVPKKRIEGQPQRWRCCIDFRALNERCVFTDRTPFTPLSIQETFHMLGRSYLFSTIDLTSAFHSIPIHKPHQFKTAFSVNGRTFYFQHTPFGLSSAPSSLGKVLEKALRNVPRSFCLYYMDDLLIYSKSARAHFQHVKIVLQALLEAGLKINLLKCSFFQVQLQFLGHLITREGYQVIPSFVEPILNWPMVRSKYEVQSFLGSCNYYNEFIHKYSIIAKPLTEVLKRPGKDEQIQKFSKLEYCEIEKAMNTLKKALTSPPILAFADFSEGASDFILDTDYSDKHHCIAAVLSQIQPPGSGRERVISYKAKTLRPVKWAYSPYKGEMMAVCYFIDKFRFFLQLRHFILRVDCQSINWLKSQKQTPSAMLLRWLQILAQNTFTVVHRPRASHKNADSLSRTPNAEMVSESSEEERALAALNQHSEVFHFDCPFCQDKALSQETLDHHVDTQHVSRLPLTFREWQQLQKSKKHRLHALFTSDPEVLSRADKPVAIHPWKNAAAPTRVNADDSISYSWDQWQYFQRLDAVLGPAMEALRKAPLKAPLEKFSIPFVTRGFLDANGVLKYKYQGATDANPRDLTVVPFVLQIPILLYFHKTMGCEKRAQTVQRALQYVYFKNMHGVFDVMQTRCNACQKVNKPMKPNRFQLISHRYVEPWHTLAIDHVGPLNPVIDGKKYILTVKDLFTGWVEFFPLSDTRTSPVIKVLAEELFVRYGVPFEILTDNATSFISKEFKKFCQDLGITLNHSSPHNPKANFAENANRSLKRKLNSFLRQQEHIGKQFVCDICQTIFKNGDLLKRHLDKHPDSDIDEAIISPKQIVKSILDQEMEERKSSQAYNWLKAIPAVLWSMRTAMSSTRGATPFELMFGKKPTSSFDLLYNQSIKRPDSKNVQEYLMARTRRNELAQNFAQQNLQRNIMRNRQYYVEIERAFAPGDLVSLFTPFNDAQVSEKLNSFWTGPWKVLSRQAPTTYTIEQAIKEPEKPDKIHTVQVDRLKRYYEEDQPVTPPVDFDPDFPGTLPQNNQVLKPKKYITKAMKDNEIIEKGDKEYDDPDDLQVIPPWKSHVKPGIPLPDEIDDPVSPKPKKQKLQPREKPVKKYAGLPAPLTTRSKSRQKDTSIASLDFAELSDRQLQSDQPHFDVDVYDQFLEQR